MQEQTRIESMHGSIGPVRKANAGRGGGRGRSGGEAPRPRAATPPAPERTGRPTAKERGKRRRKAKEAESLTSKIQPGRFNKRKSKTPAQRKRKAKEKKGRRGAGEKGKGRKGERKKEQKNGHGGSRSEAPQASAGVLPMKRHRQPLQEHGGAGVFGRELA